MFVSMADYVEEWAVPVTVIFPGSRNETDRSGRKVKGEDPEPIESQAVVLNLTNREMREVDSGRYTMEDRKIYSVTPYGIGVKVIHDGISYEIDREIPQADYTDVYRYYAKGRGKGYTP